MRSLSLVFCLVLFGIISFPIFISAQNTFSTVNNRAFMFNTIPSASFRSGLNNSMLSTTGHINTKKHFSSTTSANGWVISEMDNDRWVTGAWQHETKSTYTYNNKGDCTEFLEQTWNGNSWDNSLRDSNILDLSEKIIVQYGQSWNGSAWIDSSKLIYSYDVNGYNTEILGQQWVGGNWENNTKQTNTLDLNGQPTEMLHQYWNGSDWVNESRELITYNFFGNITEYIRQKWLGNEWVNEFRNTYTYTLSYLMETKMQNWSGGVWVDISSSLYTYDDNEHIAEILSRYWTGASWINSNRSTYAYDVNGNPTEIVFQNWFGSSWGNSFRILYAWLEFSTIVNESDIASEYYLLNNYPNPFNPSTRINYAIAKPGLVVLKIFDLLGKNVATLVNEHQHAGHYSVNWNAQGFVSGIYFYQLTVKDHIEMKKMILMK
jgi:hypothetical protein